MWDEVYRAAAHFYISIVPACFPLSFLEFVSYFHGGLFLSSGEWLSLYVHSAGSISCAAVLTSSPQVSTAAASGAQISLSSI